MKRVALLMTVALFCSSAAIAAEDTPQQPPQEIQQQMQQIRRAQNELEEQRQELDRQRQELEHQRQQMQLQGQAPQRKQIPPRPLCVAMMVICVAVHILVSIWVFQDIRTRGTGSGLWIVVALIAGLLGALVYAVVRIGDVKKS